MTITSKLVDIAGLVFAVSEETDTIDINGFSDPIQTVGAITAKFSGGGIMQANSGLRIGMNQLQINTDAEIPLAPRDSFIEDTNGSGIIGDPSSGLSSTSPGTFVVLDYESIDTQGITATTNGSFGGAGNGITMQYEISDDNISYTNLGSVTNTDGAAPTVTNFGTQTWRYIRLTHTSTTGVGGNTASGSIVENVTQPPVNDVTVRVRSSVTLDTADGDIIIDSQLMTENSQLIFNLDLLLTGNPLGDFVTLEIVSQTGNVIPVTLSDITSIKEV